MFYVIIWILLLIYKLGLLTFIDVSVMFSFISALVHGNDHVYHPKSGMLSFPYLIYLLWFCLIFVLVLSWYFVVLQILCWCPSFYSYWNFYFCHFWMVFLDSHQMPTQLLMIFIFCFSSSAFTFLVAMICLCQNIKHLHMIP